MSTDMARRLTRLTRFFFFGLAFLIFGWGFSQQSPFFSGAALGLLFGYIGASHLIRRVHLFGQAASAGRRTPNMGTMTRLALAALAAVIAASYPQYFSVPGLIIGLMAPTAFAVGEAIYSQLKLGK